MALWQQVILLLLSVSSLFFFLKARTETQRHNAFGITAWGIILGAFVWADGVVSGPFWVGVSLLSFLLHNWRMFLLFLCVFWLIRSIGEMLYWFLEQFATVHRNPPRTLFPFFIQGEEIWILYQLFWQCVAVTSTICIVLLLQQHL